MSESIFSSISPADLSLPARFDRFRQTQREALDWFQSSDSAYYGRTAADRVG